MCCLSSNSTWLVTSRLDTTRDVRRVQRVETSVSSRAVRQAQHSQNAWARHVERVVSCRDVTWRDEQSGIWALWHKELMNELQYFPRGSLVGGKNADISEASLFCLNGFGTCRSEKNWLSTFRRAGCATASVQWWVELSLTSSFLFEYSSESLNEYSLIPLYFNTRCQWRKGGGVSA